MEEGTARTTNDVIRVHKNVADLFRGGSRNVGGLIGKPFQARIIHPEERAVVGVGKGKGSNQGAGGMYGEDV